MGAESKYHAPASEHWGCWDDNYDFCGICDDVSWQLLGSPVIPVSKRVDSERIWVQFAL